MKLLLSEYGSLALSCFGGGAALFLVIAVFFSEGGAFAALLDRCMACWF